MINFCHISPTKHIGLYTQTNGAHLILAHLVEQDEEYATFYAKAFGKYKMMDNSAFEMFKQNRPMYDSSKLIEMGNKCKADCIVLTDYPREDWIKTVQKAVDTVDDIIAAGFETFFVPQSVVGDLRGYIESIRWALNNPKIHRIGLSILGCPIALGLDEKKTKKERSDSYKLQRYLSRHKILTELQNQNLLEKATKKFHCLGMTDGPNEISLLKPFHKYIASWDSSAAVWAGLNGIMFDNSPTGLIDGKFEKEVDFDFSLPTTDPKHSITYSNIQYIDKLARSE